eukprot:COSAG02_NODE_55420_length_290_cov_1.418848_1_plen_55_part_01
MHRQRQRSVVVRQQYGVTGSGSGSGDVVSSAAAATASMAVQRRSWAFLGAGELGL